MSKLLLTFTRTIRTVGACTLQYLCISKTLSQVLLGTSQIRHLSWRKAVNPFVYVGPVRMMAVDSQRNITFEQMKELLANAEGIVIDVREVDEIREDGFIPGTKNIPCELSLALNLTEEDFEKKYGFPKPGRNSKVVFHCKAGKRSEKALAKAVELGYRKSREISLSQNLIYPEVKQLKDEGKAVVIDVRNVTELESCGTLPGSYNVPLGELPEALRMSEKDFQVAYGFRKPKLDEKIIFSCRSGRRSDVAIKKAMEVGYKNLLNYGGGYLDYEKNYKHNC